MALIADVCSTKNGEMMGNMGGCRFYNPMCSSAHFVSCNCSGWNFTSSPSECVAGMHVSLPTTMIAQKQVWSICTAINRAHSSCSKCTGTVATVSSPCLNDPLDVLSDLCTSYKDNANCSEWKTWCAANTDSLASFYCNRTANPDAVQPGTTPRSSGASTLFAEKFASSLWLVALSFVLITL
jgi:hypothetical protein